jgi:uncharacterized protein (TIGR00255 family)
MLRSMTAYGRGAIETALGRFTAEIQSVNRKHLEINVLLPKELMRFDAEIKKWISARIGRGQITVKFSVVFNQTTPLNVVANLPLALKIQKAAEDLAFTLKLPVTHELTLKMLAEQPSILLFDEQMEDEELYREALSTAFEKAMQSFVEMKLHGGRPIFIDISQCLETLHQDIEQIAYYAPQATKRYREKLAERLKEFSIGPREDEERLLREIGIYAERIDISEEITLFQAHLKQFKDVLSSQKEAVAKKLEFILQELNREINTIGAKSSELEVSRRVVEIKSLLERIREIIQNVE